MKRLSFVAIVGVLVFSAVSAFAAEPFGCFLDQKTGKMWKVDFVPGISGFAGSIAGIVLDPSLELSSATSFHGALAFEPKDSWSISIFHIESGAEMKTVVYRGRFFPTFGNFIAGERKDLATNEVTNFTLAPVSCRILVLR